MPKFEYLVKQVGLYPPVTGIVDQNTELRFMGEDDLLPIDALGKDGWELVHIITVEYQPQRYMAVFKREIVS